MIRKENFYLQFLKQQVNLNYTVGEFLIDKNSRLLLIYSDISEILGLSGITVQG